MSYILEALEKDGKTKSSSGNEADENSASLETEKLDVTATPSSTTSPQSVVHTSNISISWGILLFIAIMSALVLGFWLGQQNSLSNGNNSPEVAAITVLDNVSASSLDTRKESAGGPSKGAGDPLVIEQKTSVAQTINAQTPRSSTSQRNPNPAEFFFENPPLETANKKPLNSPNEIAATIETTESIKPENIAEFTADDLKAVDGISNELLAKFKTALTETATQPDDLIEENSVDDGFSYNKNSADPYRSVKPLSDMPERLQDQLPSLQFEQHIFASDGEGWVKVNGRDRYEGDTIATGVSLIKIKPQEVILEFRDRVFSMSALSSW